MCTKLPYENPRIDQCLRGTVEKINYGGTYKTVASCCGHGKYPSTIVVRGASGSFREYFSGKAIEKRKKHRYYKRDKAGHYFIPQIQAEKE